MGDCSGKAIEEIQVGDWVWAADPETGAEGPRQVTDVIIGQGQKDLVEIEVDGHVITATDEHPFWSPSRGGWIDAEDLQVGDDLLTNDGTLTDIDRITSYTVTFQIVHNLTVDDLHTYYVVAGDQPVLVHNVDPCRVTRRLPDDELTPPTRRGNAPIGPDGHPIELHHLDQRTGNASPRAEMSRTDHRGPGNYSANHPNTGQQPSTVDRRESRAQHRQYWEEQWDSGRGGWNEGGD
jgi:hypothetical protein